MALSHSGIPKRGATRLRAEVGCRAVLKSYVTRVQQLSRAPQTKTEEADLGSRRPPPPCPCEAALILDTHHDIPNRIVIEFHTGFGQSHLPLQHVQF